MMRLLFILLFALSAGAADYKTGIDLNFAGTQGTDWQVQNWYHDMATAGSHQRIVYIKSGTGITATHNSRNYAGNMHSSSVYKATIGVNGPDGVANSGDEGMIRVMPDGDMFVNIGRVTGATTIFKHWTNSINWGTLTNWDGVTLNTATGIKPGTSLTLPYRGTAYYRGLIDAAGQTNHWLRFWDDDESWIKLAPYNLTGSQDESWASDGAYCHFVVDPLVPCLFFTTNASTAQFFVTATKAYNVPNIVPQTAYISANVLVNLDSLTAAQVRHRIDGGAWQTNSEPHSFNSSAFTTGTHTLEYGNVGSAVTMTVTISKAPTSPSASEGVGFRAWGTNGIAGWLVQSNYIATNANFTAVMNHWLTQEDRHRHNSISNAYQTGSRWFISNNRFAYPAWGNALQALYRGTNATPTGLATSFARLAQMALLNNARNIPTTGFEVSHTGSPLGSRELHYRGYYDVGAWIDQALSYDILSGMGLLTPIEEYFIRDRMAACVVESFSWGRSGVNRIGMWDSIRRMAALLIAQVMPSYSSPLYGVSGFDGTTTGLAWTPYPTDTATWKQRLFDGTVPIAPWPEHDYPLGVEENWLPEGFWYDKPGYGQWLNMGMRASAVVNWTVRNQGYVWPGYITNQWKAIEGQWSSLTYPEDGLRTFNFPPNLNRYLPELQSKGFNVTYFSGSTGDTNIYDYGASLIAWYEPEISTNSPPPVTNQVAAINITPTGGRWLPGNVIGISMACATSGATIHHTLDGSTPDSGDPVYSAPVLIGTQGTTTTIKAIGIKSGLTDSAVNTQVYDFEPVVATSEAYESAGFASQAGVFTIYLSVVATAEGATSVVGISGTRPDSAAQIAVMARRSGGVFQALDGSTWTADNALAWNLGATYTFAFTVRPASETYDLTVTPSGGSPTVIAEGYAFQPGSQGPYDPEVEDASLSYAVGYSPVGTVTITSGSAPTVSTNRRRIVDQVGAGNGRLRP